MASTPADDTPMRRVLVLGCPGAGKTTFARLLGKKLALPVIHIDFHFWRPGCRLSSDREAKGFLAALGAP